MSPLAIRRRMTRARGSLVAVACVLALSAAVIAHHSDMPVDHGMDMHGAAAMVMCLGVLGLAAVALGALPKLGRLLAGPQRPASTRPPRSTLARTAGHPTRAGPPPLFLRLSVLRR